MKMFLALATLVLSVSAFAQRGPGGGFHGGGVRGGGFHGGGFHGGGYHGGGFHGGGYRGGHWRGGVWAPVYGGGYGCGWNSWGCDDTYVSGSVACAPEVVEGNVAATDRVMKELAASPAFANAKMFQSEVKQATAIKDANERASAYMQLAGINPEDKQQIAAFVGSRDAKGAWITDLQRNAELSNEQATTVASKLQGALRGNLQ